MRNYQQWKRMLRSQSSPYAQTVKAARATRRILRQRRKERKRRVRQSMVRAAQSAWATLQGFAAFLQRTLRVLGRLHGRESKVTQTAYVSGHAVRRSWRNKRKLRQQHIFCRFGSPYLKVCGEPNEPELCICRCFRCLRRLRRPEL